MSLRGLKLILQVAFCTALMSGSANALTIIDSETDTVSGVTPLTQGELYYGGGLHKTGGFTDFFNFSLASAPLGTVTISAPDVIGAIANLTLVWWDPGSSSAISPALTVTDAFGALLPATTLAFALASATDYHLRVTGTALTDGGAYTARITTTPIPPALLLFGSALAGLGFLGRRSRRSSAPNPLA